MSTAHTISLNLFGLPGLVNSDAQPLSVRGRKSIALLGYLVLTSPQFHSRERLAGLFWPPTNAAGKTRLALQAGRCLLPSFAGGVWPVRLAALNTRTEILSHLATTLGVQLLPGDDPICSVSSQLDSRQRGSICF